MFGRESVTPLKLLIPVSNHPAEVTLYVQGLRLRMEAVYEWIRQALGRSLERQRHYYDKRVTKEKFSR